MARFKPDSSVDLYYDANVKFQTTSSGVTISGDNSTGSYIKGVARFTPNDSTTVKVLWDEGGFSGAGSFQVKDNVAFTVGDSSDLKIYHDGTDSIISNSTGDLQITDTSDDITITAADDIRLRPQGGENGINVLGDGAIELYYDNSKKLETTSTGIQMEGNINVRDNHKVQLGNNQDLQIYHNGSNSYVANSTGQLVLEGDDLMFMNSGRTESLARFQNNGAVDLYYDDTIRGSTNDAGFRVTGALQSSSGTGNYYLRTAHTTIQEGGNSVTITLSGLTFSFGVFRIGGYASAGQASVSLHIIFGGYMTHTNNYNATVLANHAQGCSISQTKNNSNYVITITNNANNYDLFCNMMIESANSAFAMALS